MVTAGLAALTLLLQGVPSSFVAYADVHSLRFYCCVCPLLTQSKENLTTLTEATNGLKTLDVFIGEKDYQALRVALRNPPIGNLRTSARKVIIAIDNKDAEEKVRVCERERGGRGGREREITCSRLETNLPTGNILRNMGMYRRFFYTRSQHGKPAGYVSDTPFWSCGELFRSCLPTEDCVPWICNL